MLSINKRIISHDIILPDWVTDGCSMIDIACAWAKLKGNNLIILVIYIPPSCPNIIYNKLLVNISIYLSTLTADEIIILGDFNIPQLINIDVSNSYCLKSQVVSNIMSRLKLTQYNHIYNLKGHLLDLVLASMNLTSIRSLDPLVPEDLYHPALEIEIELLATTSYTLPGDITCSKPTNNCSTNSMDTIDIKDPLNNNINKEYNFTIYNFNKANYSAILDDLIKANWEKLLGGLEVDDILEVFYNQLLLTFDKHVTRYTPKNTSSSIGTRFPSWFSRELINMIKHKKNLRNRIKKTAYKSSKTANHIKLVDTNKKIKKILSSCYTVNIKKIENELINEPKKFWQHINKKRKIDRIPTTFKINDMLTNNPNIIVNEFKKAFEQAYTSNNNTKLLIDLDSLNNSVNNPTKNTKNLAKVIFSSNNINKAFNKQTFKHTAGTDGIPSLFLKLCKPALIEPVRLLAHQALCTGIFPKLGKQAKVIPVYKNGTKSDISNYRPISILNNFSKIIEICLYNYIMNHIKHEIIDEQHGFIINKSTVTNLITLTNFINEAFDEHCQVDVIYTDFSKAFDKLDINLLLNKLIELCLPLEIIVLIKSYLKNRENKILVGNTWSQGYSPGSGVPQGSNLGPLLFLIYINSITQHLSCRVLLFADDTKLYAKIKKNDDAIELQRNIDLFSIWCINNGLILNKGKCQVITYHRLKAPIIHKYLINDTELSRVTTVKDLGVNFDASLSFNNHINIISHKAKSVLGFIIRVGRVFNNMTTLTTLFNTLVRPIMEYASIIWGPITQKYIDKLEKVVRRFIRWLEWRLTGCSPPKGSINNIVYKKYSIHKLEARRLAACAILGIKILKGIIHCPDLLAKLPILLSSATRQNTLLYQMTPGSTHSVKAPAYKLIEAINVITSKQNSHIDVLDNNNNNNFNIKIKDLLE